jgi:hypothetical protein
MNTIDLKESEQYFFTHGSRILNTIYPKQYVFYSKNRSYITKKIDQKVADGFKLKSQSVNRPDGTIRVVMERSQ